jgi:hypothetical protein
MTVTDPSGTPDLLTRLVDVEHARLEHLLAEAARATETPGVRAELTAAFAAELARHLAAEATVVHASARATLGDDAAALVADAEALRAASEPATGAGLGPDVATALSEHRRTVHDATERLRAALGGEAMARLGYDYSQAVEAFIHNH